MATSDGAGGVTAAGGWIDISRPLHPGTPVWPGDRGLELHRRTEAGTLVTAVTTTCHIGTHLDAPRHLDPDGAAVDDIPIDRLVGPAEVVRAAGTTGAVDRCHLPGGWEPSAPRVLVRTDSHPVGAAIGDGFVGLSVGLVRWLAGRGVVTVGIDTPSVDLFSSIALEAHRALMDCGMTWIEGLDLSRAEPGRYLLVALPLPLVGVDGAPVRAVLGPAAGGGAGR